MLNGAINLLGYSFSRVSISELNLLDLLLWEFFIRTRAKWDRTEMKLVDMLFHVFVAHELLESALILF